MNNEFKAIMKSQLNRMLKLYNIHLKKEIILILADEEIFTTNLENVGTLYTHSCTNILFYSRDFTYLIHMYPNEMLGMNNKFENRLHFLKDKIGNISELRVLISFGISDDNNYYIKYHNSEYIMNKLNNFFKYLNDLNIEVKLYEYLKSKIFVFDRQNEAIYTEKNNVKPILINNLNYKDFKIKTRR